MLVIQMTGLSGSGKTTIAKETQKKLIALNYNVEVIDGDQYRTTICKGLSFSKQDRIENVNRLGCIALGLAKHNVISIIAAINPYQEARSNLEKQKDFVRTVYIDCPLEIVKQRDPKLLYKRALLPTNDPEHLPNFTGITDPYEIPVSPHLVLQTHEMAIDEASTKLVDFILQEINMQSEFYFDFYSNIPVYKLIVNGQYMANLVDPSFEDMFWCTYKIIPLNSDYETILKDKKIWEEVQFTIIDDKGNQPNPHTFPGRGYKNFCDGYSNRINFRSLWPKRESNWTILKKAFGRLRFL
ncbi:adenylyl-sulfate kinase [Flavobacterium oreochromis]|uniref:Adenylyl-sulfate kinase n=1 Tax=Flavobacterium oreochromis TaxID=2906078 RepID=A0ABW8PBT5_9FLAO